MVLWVWTGKPCDALRDVIGEAVEKTAACRRCLWQVILGEGRMGESEVVSELSAAILSRVSGA